MARLTWTKTGRDWLGIYGQFRAKVTAPYEGGFMYHWSVWTDKKQGGSGGTSSVIASKRSAENEVARFAEWLRTQAA
jgi:hypothetical protein